MAILQYEIQYPYELNEKLNFKYSSQENISNFTSLLSDKDRFTHLLNQVCEFKSELEDLTGLEVEESIKLFVIKFELFSSCPEPLIIEYDVNPELMILHLFKEIIKNTLGKHQIRCIDEIQQMQLICATLHSFAKLIDSKLHFKLELFCKHVFESEIENLKKKGFSPDLKYIESLSISKDNTLLSIVEKSYEQLY